MPGPWTWNGSDLFGSGPHRVVLEDAGRTYIPPLAGDNFASSTLDFDVREVRLVQTGRLVAADDAGLFALMDAVRAVSEGTTPGELAGPGGRSWAGLRMMRFNAASPVDRGRVVSAAYEILYIQIGA
jgi:hypothetical protein